MPAAKQSTVSCFRNIRFLIQSYTSYYTISMTQMFFPNLQTHFQRSHKTLNSNSTNDIQYGSDGWQILTIYFHYSICHSKNSLRNFVLQYVISLPTFWIQCMHCWIFIANVSLFPHFFISPFQDTGLQSPLCNPQQFCHKIFHFKKVGRSKATFWNQEKRKN